MQNLDEKPRAGGAESGQEEHALSLRAEACNFMQPPGGRSYKTLPHVTAKTPPPMALNTPPPTTPKTPPPVAPKPPSRGELFAKRQSRADRYVVEAPPGPGLGPRPRSPSPTPSLPSSGNIHPIYVLHLLLLTTHCSHPFSAKLPKLSLVRPNPKGLGQPLSRALRLWISCGTSPANLKLPCSVLMRFPRLLDPPPQGLPKLPESRRSADFQLKRPTQ